MRKEGWRLFAVGEHVVCKGIGICAIEEVLQMPEGTAYAIWALAQDGQRQTVQETSIVRRGMDREQAEEMIDRIAYIRTIQAQNDKVYAELYELAVDTYDPVEWIKVVKTGYIRQKYGRIAADEARLSALAKAYLHTELADALSIPAESVEAHITQQLADAW